MSNAENAKSRNAYKIAYHAFECGIFNGRRYCGTLSLLRPAYISNDSKSGDRVHKLTPYGAATAVDPQHLLLFFYCLEIRVSVIAFEIVSHIVTIWAEFIWSHDPNSLSRAYAFFPFPARILSSLFHSRLPPSRPHRDALSWGTLRCCSHHESLRATAIVAPASTGEYKNLVVLCL